MADCRGGCRQGQGTRMVCCGRSKSRKKIRGDDMRHAIAKCTIVAAVAMAAGPAAAQAQYPTKPVRVIVPYPPGGGNDTLARLFGQKLTEAWGQQFVIENRPGAGTIIGTAAAAKSPADGYTILLSSIATHAFSPHLYSKPGYDPVKDFAPITLLVIAPTLLVVRSEERRVGKECRCGGR